MKTLFSLILMVICLINPLNATTVGVIATDKEELGNIVSYMDEPVNSYTYGTRTFYLGKLWGHETIIVLSNVGKAAAAAATVDLIHANVDCIILLGTAGALDKRLNIGDIVIADRLLEFDADFSPFASPYHFPDRNKELATDQDLRLTCQLSIREFLKDTLFAQIDEQTRHSMQMDIPKSIIASVGTADHFLISQEDLKNLASFAPEVVCVDMESAAVAYVTDQYHMPFVAIRTISNYIDTPSEHNLRVALDYNAFLEKVQAVYTKNILQSLFNNLNLKNNTHHLKHERTVDLRIFCTTEDELQSLLEIFNQQPEKINHEGKVFYLGTIGKHNAMLIASGIGKAASSATAQEIILNYKPQLLLQVGHAESVDDNVKYGDIVVSNTLIESDVDVRPFRPLFQLPTIGITNLPADSKTINLIGNRSNIHIGLIASGDKLLNQLEQLILKGQLPEVLCIDSEAAPAAHICYLTNTPFVSIKEVSENRFKGVFSSKLKILVKNLLNSSHE